MSKYNYFFFFLKLESVTEEKRCPFTLFKETNEVIGANTIKIKHNYINSQLIKYVK